MTRRARILFAALVLAQAAHSVEEYRYRLWEVLPPARVVSALVAADLPVGFAVVNVALVAFGAWCYVALVRRGDRRARAWAWSWAALEAANGTAHLLMALGRGGYFPGVATAPLLVGIAAALATALLRRDAPDHA